MIELILVFCLSDSPDRCMERREPFAEYASPLQCTMNAQHQARQYLDSHPNYTLAGWRCEIDKPQERPA